MYFESTNGYIGERGDRQVGYLQENALSVGKGQEADWLPSYPERHYHSNRLLHLWASGVFVLVMVEISRRNDTYLLASMWQKLYLSISFFHNLNKPIGPQKKLKPWRCFKLFKNYSWLLLNLKNQGLISSLASSHLFQCWFWFFPRTHETSRDVCVSCSHGAFHMHYWLLMVVFWCRWTMCSRERHTQSAEVTFLYSVQAEKNFWLGFNAFDDGMEIESCKVLRIEDRYSWIIFFVLYFKYE